MTRVDIQARVGWVIYAKKVPLWDSNTVKLTDFSTRFSFTIGSVRLGTPNFGDGLAPAGIDNIAPNTAGGGLGLFNASTPQPCVHLRTILL